MTTVPAFTPRNVAQVAHEPAAELGSALLPSSCAGTVPTQGRGGGPAPATPDTASSSRSGWLRVWDFRPARSAGTGIAAG